ncbi:hypothetical protein [uncultured Bifidobacterium sp.]|uniref:hypothetical protein n=1 Tax=uncultured Bifidobacterium sp. TaxID=165187 RepID=UPI0026301C4A|nr:hypothetical protein [uncultured Bifidobacterium sp.]
MCYEVTCPICGKKTWAGCGMHIDQVMRGIPQDQWRPGHGASARHGSGQSSSTASPGLFGKLFGR